MILVIAFGITYANAITEDDDGPVGSIGSTDAVSQNAVDLPTNGTQATLGNTGVIDDRNRATTVKEQLNHQAVIAYVEMNMSENGWNQAMRDENIRIYNLETRIGQEVAGYELVALSSQKEILAGAHDPTEAEARLLEWAKTQYDIPFDLADINDRIVDMVGIANIGLVDEFTSSVKNMTNHGNVGPSIRATDPDFWDMVGSLSLCSYVEACNSKDTTGRDSDIKFVTNFANHWADIRITYSPL